MARPSTYSPEIAAEICSRIADGKSLRAICTSEDMPAKSSVFKWLKEEDGFSDQYKAACHERAEFHAEETLEIADNSGGDYVETENGPKFVAENVQRARLRVETRKWFASKLAPKVYGDKIALGGDGEGSGNITVTWASGPIPSAFE